MGMVTTASGENRGAVVLVVSLLVGSVLAGCGTTVSGDGAEATDPLSSVVDVSDEAGTTADVASEEGMPVVDVATTISSSVSGLGMLQGLHDELVQADGAVIEGQLAEAETADRLLVLDAPTIVWAVSVGTASELIVDGKLTITLSGSLDADVLTAGVQQAAVLIVAVGGDGELLSLAPVSQNGEFIPLEQSTVLPNALAIGGGELFRTQYVPPPENPCVTPAVPSYESPVDALVTYLTTLGNLTELAIERTHNERERRVTDVFSESPTFVDPVTGFVVNASVNDIGSQLDDGPGSDVVLRGAIPVEIKLLSPEAATESTERALVFIDVDHSNVLGWFPMGTQVGSSDSVILEIAPPVDGSDVAVVTRQENVQNTSCGMVGTDEPVMVIPFEDFAGETRISISLQAGIYETVTEFEPDE
jgi:hypothetical protein